MKKKSILLCFIISFFSICYGQEQTSPDSLITYLKTFSQEKERIEFLANSVQDNAIVKNSDYVSLLKEYKTLAIKNNDWESSLVFENALGDYLIYDTAGPKKAYELLNNYRPYLNKAKSTKQIALFYITYAEAATYMQKYKISLDILNEGIVYMEKAKDSSLYEFGYAYLKAGENSTKINEISESASYYKKASEIFIHQKDTLFYLWTQNGLSTLFSANGLYKEAEESREIIYNYGEKIGERQVVAMAHLRACIDAHFLDQPEKEIYHIEKALENNNENSDVQEVVTILCLSYAVVVYSRNNLLKKADEYLALLNIKMENQKDNAYLKTYYHIALSHYNYGHKNYDKAENFAVSTLKDVKKAKEFSLQMQLEILLANINEKQGRPEDALDHYKKHVYIKDSIAASSSRKKFAYVQTLFETEKKDLQISKQRKNIALLHAKNKIKAQ